MKQESISPKDVHSVIGSRMLADGLDMVLDLENSKGARLYDSSKDRYLLDFFGFFASNPVGVNHPGLEDADFLKDLKTAALTKVTNSDIYTRQMAEFVDTFSREATPDYMKYLFFVSGGALAVENGLKAAFDWKVRKNFANGETRELGSKVMHLKEAFHGRSGYTLSLTNTHDPRKTEYFPKFDWPRVTNPKLRFPLTEKVLQEVEEQEKKSLSEMENYFEKFKNDIALFIMEPIQGEGGDNYFRNEYFKAVAKLVKENDALLMMDEVQAGMGVTGKWWAHQHYDVKPDIVSFGKKSQVCGIMVGSKIDEAENNVFHESSRINSTWGGNLVDMVRSKRFIEIMKEESLIENAEKVGKVLVDELKTLSSDFPELVSNARGMGVMAAFDLKSEKLRDVFFDKMFSKGVLLLKAGESTIRLRPALIISEEDIKEFSGKAKEVLKEMS